MYMKFCDDFFNLFFRLAIVKNLPPNAGFFFSHKFPQGCGNTKTRHNRKVLKKRASVKSFSLAGFRAKSYAYRMNAKNTPKDIFLHLFGAVAFYASAISAITLLVQYVNVLFPDVLDPYRRIAATESVFWSGAIILVAYPAYLFTTRVIGRDAATHPEKQSLPIRKWISYATLFVSALAVGGDLIALIYNFLRGELTLPFALKVLSILAVAGSVFWYVSWDRKQENGSAATRRKQIAWIASIALIIIVGAEFLIVGTPGEQRRTRLDQQRVNDLQILQNQLVNYWIQKEKIPARAEELEDDISGFRVPRDPETDEPYAYRQTGSLSFELCAAFATDDTNDAGATIPKPPILFERRPYPSNEENWSHGAGRACFSRTIDPELYKPTGAGKQ